LIPSSAYCSTFDDFGTSFSSPGALAHAEVDALKIDSSFVAHLDARICSALLETVIQLARKLEL
jgi:EAL domain-containing protein (putative c-di-GMP-specific phosphodiesterase class I)